jgi:hypothetical protein
MSNYIAITGGSLREVDRRNRSKPRLEIPSARTQPESHSARFGHFALRSSTQPEFAQTKAESARIVTL